MRNVSENMNKYGEKMTGKFSHNPSKDGIVISVISPFDEEIHMDCDNDIYQEYRNTYSLLEPQADHPDNERYDRLFYYNTQEKLYYRARAIQLYVFSFYEVNCEFRLSCEILECVRDFCVSRES